MSKPHIEILYDPDAYEEQQLSEIVNFLKQQKAEASTSPYTRRALDVPSLIAFAFPSFAGIYFLKGFCTKAGEDAWELLKTFLWQALCKTKKSDTPQLEIRIDLENGKQQIVSGIEVKDLATMSKFLDKYLFYTESFEEMTKNCPVEHTYITLKFNIEKEVFEATGYFSVEEWNITYNFETKKWGKHP